jgi:hypothetical protein
MRRTESLAAPFPRRNPSHSFEWQADGARTFASLYTAQRNCSHLLSLLEDLRPRSWRYSNSCCSTLLGTVGGAGAIVLVCAPFAGTPLRCLLMVITQQAAQSLAALNTPVAADVRTPRELSELRQDTFSLAPMPKGAFAEVIKGPDATARRHRTRY